MEKIVIMTVCVYSCISILSNIFCFASYLKNSFKKKTNFEDCVQKYQLLVLISWNRTDRLNKHQAQKIFSFISVAFYRLLETLLSVKYHLMELSFYIKYLFRPNKKSLDWDSWFKICRIQHVKKDKRISIKNNIYFGEAITFLLFLQRLQLLEIKRNET